MYSYIINIGTTLTVTTQCSAETQIYYPSSAQIEHIFKLVLLFIYFFHHHLDFDRSKNVTYIYIYIYTYTFKITDSNVFDDY